MSRIKDLRSALLRTAMDLVEAGETEISLRNVARETGVSAMAPYRHFPDKAALLGAVADQGFDELHKLLLKADRGGEGRGALVEQGLAYIGFALRRPNLFRLMFASRGIVRSSAEADQGYIVLANRVAREMPDHREPWTLGCWGLVHGLAMLTLDERISVADGELRQTLELLLQIEAAPGKR